MVNKFNFLQIHLTIVVSQGCWFGFDARIGKHFRPPVCININFIFISVSTRSDTSLVLNRKVETIG